MLDQTYSQEFEVQQIIDQKIIDGETHFLVKWIGYGHQENTWEPIRHMTNSKDKIKQWEKYKLKQLSLLQNYKLLEDLDLQTHNKKFSPQVNAEFIEAARKSSTPYKNFKPVILLDIKDPLDERQDKKITSLFDRPEVKKLIKRKKIERKKKDLEIFEQRLKSRPKIWEKYIQNEDEAIKLANQKIKEVVDQVFGTKMISAQKPQQKDKEENIKSDDRKKEKPKIFEIFSESDEQRDAGQQEQKSEKAITVMIVKKTSFQKDHSDSEINESTNFISTKKTQPHSQDYSRKEKHNNHGLTFQKDENQRVFIKPESKHIQVHLFPKSCPSIQPETIRLDMSMIKRLQNQKPVLFETQDSSSSNDFESQCRNYSLSKKSFSSSSQSSKDQTKTFKTVLIEKDKNSIQSEKEQKPQSIKEKTQSQKNFKQKQEISNLEKAIEFKRNAKSKKKRAQNIFTLSSDHQGKDNQAQLIEKLSQKSLSKQSSSQIIKQEEPNKCLQKSQQEGGKFMENNSYCPDQQINSVKLEWTIAKKINEKEAESKFQSNKFLDEKMNLKVENTSNNKITSKPFECSVSTIEGAETSDEFDQTSKTMRQKKPSVKELQSSINEIANFNNDQKIINYSSLTDHLSTALPSQDSGESYHIFSTQNAFQQNFLQNRSLSTRASFNTCKTQNDNVNFNTQPNHQVSNDRNQNDLHNQDLSLKTPHHIFSSSNSSEIIDKLNFTEIGREYQKQNIQKSLSLEYLLQKINSISSNLSNIHQDKQSNFQPQNEKKSSTEHKVPENLIEPLKVIAERSIEGKCHKSSEQSSDLKRIESENQRKSSKKTSKRGQFTIQNSSAVNVSCPRIKETPTNDLSQFHQKFILSHNLLEEFPLQETMKEENKR